MKTIMKNLAAIASATLLILVAFPRDSEAQGRGDRGSGRGGGGLRGSFDRPSFDRPSFDRPSSNRPSFDRRPMGGPPIDGPSRSGALLDRPTLRSPSLGPPSTRAPSIIRSDSPERSFGQPSIGSRSLSRPSLSPPARPSTSGRAIQGAPTSPPVGRWFDRDNARRRNLEADVRPGFDGRNRSAAGERTGRSLRLPTDPESGLGNRPRIQGPSTQLSLPGGDDQPGIMSRRGSEPSFRIERSPQQPLREEFRDPIDRGNRSAFGDGFDIIRRPSQNRSLPGMADDPGPESRDELSVGRPSRQLSLPGMDDRFEDGRRSFPDGPGWSRREVSDRVEDIRVRLVRRPDEVPPTGRDPGREHHDHWEDWHDHHFKHHHHWHHGHRHVFWRPIHHWDYWWRNYPVLWSFGLTHWGINRAGWAFGYYDYHNPYAARAVYYDNRVYDYSQPLIVARDAAPLAADVADAALPPGVTEEGLAAFDQARQAFFAGDYRLALRWTDDALREMPDDAVVHEFRALVMFALGRYQDAAAALHAVLSAGPGWDWATMSGLYPSVAEYTTHLRALEAARDAEPQDPAIRFVLAYHYVTTGHEQAAAEELRKLLRLNPEDQLAAEILQRVDPDAAVPEPPRPVVPPKPAADIQAHDLMGHWVATRDDSTFAMVLRDDNTFSWTYTKNGRSQEVGGVWAVDEDGVLALEIGEDDVLLAQVVLEDGKMDFYMIGDTRGAEPLEFTQPAGPAEEAE